jgi:biopolymer transport protein ExbB
MGHRVKRSAWFTLPGLFVLVLASPALAQTEEVVQQTLFEMFFLSKNILGMIITWVLILMSVAVSALVIHHLIRNRKSSMMPDESIDTIEALLAERKFREAIEESGEDDSLFGQIMHTALSEASNGFGAMERAIEETGDVVSSRRIRSLEILNVLGAVGPMLGLFGTVYGMIVAFNKLATATSSNIDPAELADGISTALVTTFWGLVVGIPAIAAYSLIRNRIDGLTAESMLTCEELISQFRPARKPKRQ